MPDKCPSPPDVKYRVSEALKACERGWPLLQLVGKTPLHKAWPRAATPNPDKVCGWAETGSLGMRTGVASGVIVIDDDTPDQSAARILGLPTTVTVITGSGKRHYYFKAPGAQITNKRGSLPDGVDVRGNGGQVVFPGSIHPDTGKPYKWAPGLSPEEIEMVELPQNVIDQIRTPKGKNKKGKAKTKKRQPVAVDEGARQALANSVSAVAAASEGERNNTLNTEAFRMGRWVNANLITRTEVETALSDTARSAGLEESEVENTVRSGLEAGCTSPFRQHGGRPHLKEKPAIMLEGGKLPEIVVEAEQALLSSGVQFYQRGDLIIRVLRALTITMRAIYRRAEGVLMLCTVDATYLVEQLTRCANWYRMVKGDLVLVDCPERVARTYLARSGHWKFPRLLGVVETPTLRPDGSILDSPGYDAATCLLYQPGSTKFPVVPENPTREAAINALDRLLVVVKDFPFLEESDRSVAIAAILTALIRQSVRTAPLFAFRAPKMASGKSLLSDVVALISTGRTASVMSQGRDEDEDKKRMLAILMEGINVATIDNIEREFGGAALCSILTQESWRERVLGRTGTATVPTAVTWMATGNNIRFVGDIVTRVIPCDLDPRIEHPEERKFDVDLHEYIPEHRPELVVAGLTILRAYVVAGKPSQGLSVFGRFEEWSGWVRSALVWLGQADPCAGRARLVQHDPVSNRLRALLSSWHAEFGDKCRTVAEAIALSIAVGPLSDAILAVAEKGGKPDGRRLGKYLDKYERRTEAGLRIERAGDRQNVVLWRVVEISPPPSNGSKTGASVGLVGFVGSSHQVAEELGKTPSDNNSQGELGFAVVTEKKDATLRRPSGTNPPNPPNPPILESTPPEYPVAGGGALHGDDDCIANESEWGAP